MKAAAAAAAAAAAVSVANKNSYQEDKDITYIYIKNNNYQFLNCFVLGESFVPPRNNVLFSFLLPGRTGRRGEKKNQWCRRGR